MTDKDEREPGGIIVDRCEVLERIEDWPYARRCLREAHSLSVHVDVLHEDLDLCEEHLFKYIDTLPLGKAKLVRSRYKGRGE